MNNNDRDGLPTTASMKSWLPSSGYFVSKTNKPVSIKDTITEKSKKKITHTNGFSQAQDQIIKSSAFTHPTSYLLNQKEIESEILERESKKLGVNMR